MSLNVEFDKNRSEMKLQKITILLIRVQSTFLCNRSYSLKPLVK